MSRSGGGNKGGRMAADKNKEKEKHKEVDIENTEISYNFDSDRFPNGSDCMGYRHLESLSVKTSSEILPELANSHSGFEELLKSRSLSFDQMYLIMKVLGKICRADFQGLVGSVLAQARVPEFVDNLHLTISSLPTERTGSYKIDKFDSFFENLLIFYQTLLDTSPRSAVNILNSLLRFTEINMKNVRDLLYVNLNEEYFTKLRIMQEDVKSLLEENKKKEEAKEKNQIFPEPLDNIRDISLYPEPNDIHLQPAPVRPNIVRGGYTNPKHYLDVQFRLLREDFISPLRKGINDFVHKHSDNKAENFNNIRIYKKVRFLKTRISLDKVGYIICFDVDNTMKNINLEFSKRFMYGSLLLFTNNNFETFFMGTVINRGIADLKNKQVTVQLVSIGSGGNDNLLKCDYLMAESEVYFEPYFHVLRALQNMDTKNFPLDKYIVNVHTYIDVPLYLKNGLDIYEMTVKSDVRSFHILDNRSWPRHEDLCLDESQYRAFRAALTNELAVIQGPPGTGKTYIGLKIMETLLRNKIVWNQPNEVPILVVCYTNHALDQFLEGILKCTTNIIRIGAQSRNEMLEPFNLKNRRRYYGYERGQSALMNDLKKKMSTILNNIKTLQNDLDNIQNHEGIISLKFLCNIMTLKERLYFNNNSNLIAWLLEEVQPTVTKSSFDLIDEEYTFLDTNENNIDVLDNDEDFENLQRMQAMYVDTFDICSTEDKSEFAKLTFACTIQNVEKKYHELVDKVTAMINSDKRKRSDFKSGELQNLRKAISDLQEILDYIRMKLNNKDKVKENRNRDLQACKDIQTLPYNDRWILYKLWLERLKVWYKDKIRNQERSYRNDGLNFEEARQMEDLKVLKTADVVGTTTTTAAKLQAMLKALQPKIVIIEEAAEVLEAHIIASLTSHCKHLVLIGDHKQLRPNPADYTVAKDLKLEISLFERLINNGIECYTLNIQHRMRPEISKLLVPTIYPTLLDHPNVLHRDKIKGVDKNVFFITHSAPEQEIVEISSKQNVHEANFLIALCRHLLLQGYKPQDITILTTYSGQLYYLRNEKKKHNLPRDLCIRVVDNFQGEESKIILLSLVRSNSENNVGFLKTENRVCVALSRARDGLYIIGNMNCLTGSSELWQKINEKLMVQGSVGAFLTLRCEIHPDHYTKVVTASDFHKVSEGGCGQLCAQLLKCGHTCKSLCHVINKTHDMYTCREPCLRKCKNKHQCQLQCYVDCRKCDVPVQRELLCGHRKQVPCHVNIDNYVCRVEVEVRFEACNHLAKLPCFQHNCPAPCEFRLNCGHACERCCHVNEDPDHLEYVCMKPCAQLRRGCSADHNCRRTCFEECEPCNERMVRELPCKHTQNLLCAQDIALVNCKVNVVKTVQECGHEVTIRCSETPTRKHCNSECQTILPCGHKCSKKCSDECDINDCTEGVVIETLLICGHKLAYVPCNLKHKQHSFLHYCMEPCEEMLDCKHMCNGTCGKCYQGRIHKACEQNCGKTLICGHSCTVPCNMICPPCSKPCTQKCAHNKCPRKCGEICAPCNEPCTYNCEHYMCGKRCSEICDRPCCDKPCKERLCCSHKCVGFCGEPCPPCKQCEPDVYEEFPGFGNEDDDDARFVRLDECGHVFESSGLEHWFALAQDNGEIVQKTCPQCKTSVVKTHRFMDLIKPVMKTIDDVKRLIFGKQKEIHMQREQLKKKLKEKTFLESETYSNGIEGYKRDSDELYLLYKKLQDDLSIIKNNRRNEIGIEKARLLGVMVEFVCMIIDKYKKHWEKLKKTDKPKIVSKTNFLISLLQERQIKISIQEINSFSLELNRLMVYIDLKVIVSYEEFDYCIKSNSEAQTIYADVQKHIRSIKTFNSALHSVVITKMERLGKLTSTFGSTSVLTEEEKKMIVQVMGKYCIQGTAVGHFFKCRNGHPYVITDCEGPMQQSICPVGGCGSVIGGKHNRLAEGQQLASEIDGARYAAWYPENNM